jgi:hypothetical protein
MGRVPVSNSKTTEIPLALPSLQAMALAHFVKRVDFEMVARFASVTVVSDGESEADLIWLALIALRNALAEADVGPRRGRYAGVVVPLATKLMAQLDDLKKQGGRHGNQNA